MPESGINQLILQRLEEIGTQVIETGLKVASIQTTLSTIVGKDGNNGRLKDVEDDIEGLQKFRTEIKTTVRNWLLFFAGVDAAIEIILHAKEILR